MATSNIRRVKPAASNRISAYLLHHLQSLLFSLGKIYQAPSTTIETPLTASELGPQNRPGLVAS